jgi:hypothetical protein
MPECLRHEFPFDIRLLETGDVTAFDQSKHCAADAPPMTFPGCRIPTPHPQDELLD